MRRRKNTPELWDELWVEETSRDEDLYELARERSGIRFRRIANRIIRSFGRFEGLRVIEIGAGAGTNATLLAELGAEVTVLDYSKEALARSSAFFEHAGLQATRIRADALSLPNDLRGAFDVALSFGLAEHFRGERRVTVIGAHLDLLRPGGIAFVSVPNAANPPYRLAKVIAELTGLWRVGEEYPFSRGELSAICDALGVRDYAFFGDSLVHSLRFVDPVAFVQRRRGVHRVVGTSRIRVERGTFLDARLAYALVLCAVKSEEP